MTSPGRVAIRIDQKIGPHEHVRCGVTGKLHVGQRLHQAGGDTVDLVGPKPAFDLDAEFLGAGFYDGHVGISDGQYLGCLQPCHNPAHSLPKLFQVREQRIEPIDLGPILRRFRFSGGCVQVPSGPGNVVLRHGSPRIGKRPFQGLLSLVVCR